MIIKRHIHSTIPRPPRGSLEKLQHRFRERARRIFFRTYARSTNVSDDAPIVIAVGLMRSGSSLLTKLLCSNKSMSGPLRGFGETHIGIRRASDFQAIAGKINWVLRKQVDGTQSARFFYFDKLLHDYHLKPNHYALLEREHVRLIFTVREPEATVASLVHSLNYPLFTATTYYLAQIKHIGRIQSRLNIAQRDSLLLTYDQLVDETRDTLDRLQKFLQLPVRLSDHYHTNLITETNNKGVDNSDLLLAGRVVRRPKAPRRVDIPKPLLDELVWHYDNVVGQRFNLEEDLDDTRSDWPEILPTRQPTSRFW